MPRIVPSRVVDFIDRVFPQGTNSPRLGKGNAGQLRALIDLFEGVPDELLVMDSESYASLVCSVAHIRQTLESWIADRQSRFSLDPIPGFSEEPVTMIRTALAGCPDEGPTVRTEELKFIPAGEFRTNLRTDLGSVDTALANGEWKAVTVIAGSAIEALLLWALQEQPQADREKAFRIDPKLPNKPLDEWHLPEYIEAADRLKIITTDTATQARLAQNFRNFIHPGRVQRYSQKCDIATAHSAFAALQHVIRDLAK